MHADNGVSTTLYVVGEPRQCEMVHFGSLSVLVIGGLALSLFLNIGSVYIFVFVNRLAFGFC